MSRQRKTKSQAAAAPPPESPPPRWWKRLLFRGLGAVLGFIVFYAVFLVLGYVPINGDYQPPPAADRVVIFIRANDIHTDFVLPVREPETNIDWRDVFPAEHFQTQVASDKYVAVGWGDRGFYMDTPQWKDLKFSTLVNALFLPSESVLHVEYLPSAGTGEFWREVHVSRAQYQILVAHIRAAIRPNEHGQSVSAGDVTYGRRDHFFQARGSYHLFNTCNQWTGRGLKKAGVPTGLWTPLKDQVLRPLPKPAAE